MSRLLVQTTDKTGGVHLLPGPHVFHILQSSLSLGNLHQAGGETTRPHRVSRHLQALRHSGTVFSTLIGHPKAQRVISCSFFMA